MGKTSWKTWFYKKQNQHSKKIIKHSFINNVTMQSHMIMKPAAFCVCLAINTRHAQAHTNVFSNYCLHCMSFEKIMNDTYKNLFFPPHYSYPSYLLASMYTWNMENLIPFKLTRYVNSVPHLKSKYACLWLWMLCISWAECTSPCNNH